MITPFECDFCIFRKLRLRDLDRTNVQDNYLMICIRRMNLDAFWSKAPSTVKQNATLVKRMIESSAKVGNLHGPFERASPLPPHDHCGYHIAFLMLDDSRNQGKYHKTHKQFDSVRRIRSAFSNFVRTTPSTLMGPASMVLVDNNGKTASRIGNDESGSLWFSRFAEGLKRRMGQDWRPDQAITPDLLLAVLSSVEQTVVDSESLEWQYTQIMAGTFFVIAYVLSLRGPEGFLLDLEGLRRHGDSLWHRASCVVIALWGQFKGENAERAHLLPCCDITGSGIPVRTWVRRAVLLALDNNKTKGPLMTHRDGKKISSWDIDEIFHFHLTQVWNQSPHLFPSHAISDEEDIVNKYSNSRSFWRESNTRAKEMNVSIPDTDIINRWRVKESAGTRKEGGSMDQTYTDPTLLLAPFLRYTQQM